MRKGTLIRWGLASVILAGGAGGALAVGCSGDDNVTPTDAGADHFVTPVDGGGTDTGGGGMDAGADAKDAAPKPQHGKVAVVHASPDLGAVRFCFATNPAGMSGIGQVQPLQALPHAALPGQPYPGLFPGTGGVLPDLVDLEPLQVTGFLIDAQKIMDQTADAAAEKNCVDLIGQDGQGAMLKKNQDYWQLNTIPAGTFAHGSTTLVAAAGCLDATADPQASTARCGTDWMAATGNVQALTFKLDRATDAGAGIGTQVAHSASAWDGVLSALGGVAVAQNVLLVSPDAGPVGAVATGVNYKDLKPPTAGEQPADFFADPHNLVVVQTEGANDAGTINTAGFPLGLISQLTTGKQDYTGFDAGGPFFAPSMAYTFVLLGDPLAEQLVADGGPNPKYEGYGLHVIAFPNNPPVPPFQ